MSDGLFMNQLLRETNLTIDAERLDRLHAAAERPGAPIETAVVVGNAIWDMLAARRCRGLGVGLLSGGYGQDELERAGAARVFEDPANLLQHLDEVGGLR